MTRATSDARTPDDRTAAHHPPAAPRQRLAIEDRQARDPRQLPPPLASAATSCSPASSATTTPSSPRSTSPCSPGTTCCSSARRGRRRAGSCGRSCGSSTRTSRTSTSPAARSTKTRIEPITRAGQGAASPNTPEDQVPIAWWPREERYAERLAPGTKFADVIGEIDPAKLAAGTSMSAEDALHFGLIPRMHRGIFAMNEMPELDELVQVGLFNILEERDVQIRGYPIQFDLDVLILFSRQPGDVQPLGQGDPAAEGPHRLDHPDALPARPRRWASRSWSRRRASTSAATFPVLVPYFMKEIIEQISVVPASRSTSITQSGVSARLQHRQLPHDGRQRPAPRRAARREARRAAHQRPGPPARVVARQARTRHDGQPPDERAAGARRDHRRGDPSRCSRSTSTSTAWTRSRRSSARA